MQLPAGFVALTAAATPALPSMLTSSDGSIAQPERESSARFEALADTSIVIVSWKARDYLIRCLESIREFGGIRIREVIVVENGSQDGSDEVVASRFPEVILVTPGRNLGYAAGNNEGLKHARGDYLLLLNPDTELTPGALDSLTGFMDAHPACAVSAPQLIHPNGVVQRSCRSFPFPAAILPEFLGSAIWGRFLPALAPYRLPGWSHDTERQVDQPMGSALLIRRRVIEEVGRMDEQFPLFFNEVDWLYRIRQAGGEIWFTPRSRMLHHGGVSTRQVKPRAAWLSHTGLHSFYAKHLKGRLHPALYLLIVGLIYARAVVVVGFRLLQRFLSRTRP